MERTDPRVLATTDAADDVGRPHALVVDDDPVGRLALQKLLGRCGYGVTTASNGAEGVCAFERRRPDIVFMDMTMPVMDGLAATLRIKQACAGSFVPVIFVTGNNEEEDIARCIEAGGDDFITKPFSHTILAAKVQAMDRIRELHRRTRAMHTRLHEEQLLAKRVLEGAVMGPNAAAEGLAVHLAPAATFNGDLMLSAHAPSGDLHVLLGDFTGHGLAATIGALPAAETFRAMSAKGFAPTRILAEINRKLRTLLPTGMFLAATFVRVDAQRRHAAIVNCGMPDVLVLDGAALRTTVASATVPLSVLAEDDYAAATVLLPLAPDTRVVLASDGVLDVANAAGERFGPERLLPALLAGAASGTGLAPAIAAIESFRNGMLPADDISLAEIVPARLPAAGGHPGDRVVEAGAGAPGDAGAAPCASGWRLALELRGATLRRKNPVPMLLSLLGEFDGLEAHRAPLFTVLAELYNNALDHGVLGLDSTLKERDIAVYLEERDSRLGALAEGAVRIELDGSDCAAASCLSIAVQDSGAGFDPAALPEPPPLAPHGRGIRLVRSLCQALDYDQPGNRARARYPLIRRDGECGS